MESYGLQKQNKTNCCEVIGGMPADQKGTDMQELQKYYEVRYHFEHELLPEWFYGAGKDELQKIRNRDTSFIWSMWRLLYEERGLKLEGTKNPFKASKCTIGDNRTIIRIDMPTPCRQPLCFHVFLVWSDDFERRGYFTVERGASNKEKFLCSWREGRAHGNYGKCSSNTAKVEKRIISIFDSGSSSVWEEWKRLWLPVSAIICIGVGIALYVGMKRRKR